MRTTYRPRTSRQPPRAPAWIVAAALLASSSPAEARSAELGLRYLSLELPGAPSTILPADVDGDGRRDLVVVVAYTEWDQFGIEEASELDGVEGLIEVLTIVTSLIDRRELYVFLAGKGGGYRALDEALELDRSVLSLELGPPGLPVVALTDDGLSTLSIAGGRAALEPIFTERPILAGTGTFVPRLGMVHDLDGDGRADLLFPGRDGYSIYLADGAGLRSTPAARLALPADPRRRTTRLVRQYPLPEVRDVDGDRLPELLLPHHRDRWRAFHVFANASGGRFGAPLAPLGGGAERGDAEESEEEAGRIVYFGDLDGDGRAEYVTQRELFDYEDAGMRKAMRAAKRPPYRYRLYRMGDDWTMAEEPYYEFTGKGYTFGGDEDDGIYLPGGFQDLDGDGRQDLVGLTLDFSLMQVVRVLTTKSVSIGLDFHVWCQGDDGGFRAVQGLDLSGKFKLNLNDLKLRRLSQFAGDFDGDGRADFVQMGRGRAVTLHLGRERCFYPPQADLTVQLREEPRDLGLVQIDDFDGDGLTDLIVIQPQPGDDPEVTPTVRLDAYLSGGEP